MIAPVGLLLGKLLENEWRENCTIIQQLSGACFFFRDSECSVANRIDLDVGIPNRWNEQMA